MTSWIDRLNEGLDKTRLKLTGSINAAFGRGIELDEEFFETLEEALLAADVGMEATVEIVDEFRLKAKASAFSTEDQVFNLLEEMIAAEFETAGDPFSLTPAIVLMVGINGTGKTTSTGKLAFEAASAGKKVLIGSADTFRAAAVEQLDIWAKRAQVEIVSKDRGADAAAVAYDTVARAEEIGADLALIDTAGRLHTSQDLMRELEKVQRTARDRASVPIFTVLVMDATTGQNGLVQAKRFHEVLGLDAIILTKLDGTAKGGIAVAISRELRVPIVRIGVGESIEDLQAFEPQAFAHALVGRNV